MLVRYKGGRERQSLYIEIAKLIPQPAPLSGSAPNKTFCAWCGAGGPSVLMKPFLPFPVDAVAPVALFPNFNTMDPVQKAVIKHTFGGVAAKRKQVITCSVCRLRFNSDSQAASHFRGGRHAKKVKSQENKTNGSGSRKAGPAHPMSTNQHTGGWNIMDDDSSSSTCLLFYLPLFLLLLLFVLLFHFLIHLLSFVLFLTPSSFFRLPFLLFFFLFILFLFLFLPVLLFLFSSISSSSFFLSPTFPFLLFFSSFLFCIPFILFFILCCCFFFCSFFFFFFVFFYSFFLLLFFFIFCVLLFFLIVLLTFLFSLYHCFSVGCFFTCTPFLPLCSSPFSALSTSFLSCLSFSFHFSPFFLLFSFFLHFCSSFSSPFFLLLFFLLFHPICSSFLSY
ncbi:zinc finger protein 385B isoform X3 [Nerophis ophidion]|uniref:zinc finger protein 385B isoform X3 n=1 Tax=Nerophis ophidion TaxID=159077 RepID=UPI002ADF31DE|nr:zinc finger protein 385B isoform X3 [Nerophis ophidion]